MVSFLLSTFFFAHIPFLRFIPLPKSARSDRIKSNFTAFDFELSEIDMKELDRLDRGKEGLVTWCASAVQAP